MVWYDHPGLCDRKRLKRQLLAGMTIEEIARRNGCSRGAVRAAMQHHNIKRPLIHMPQRVKETLRL